MATIATEQVRQRASEQDRTDIKKRRDIWQESQPTLDLEKLVFLEESGAMTLSLP